MGKGGDKNSGNANSSTKELLIDGRLYDVTTFKHPGGSVINYYAGEGMDATQAFNNFHLRSAKAKKYLANLPSRPAPESTFPKKEIVRRPSRGSAAVPISNDTAVHTAEEIEEDLQFRTKLLRDFNKFEEELRAEGFFNPSPAHALYRIFEIFALHALGFYLLFHQQLIAGIFVLGVIQGRCGWLMHEGGHYSLTGVIPVDLFLQVLLYGLGCGMSASWWRNQHNKHHSTPQKLGYDVDLNTLPLVAFTSKVIARASGKKVSTIQKLWIQNQSLLFPTLTTLLVALGWQLYLHPRHILRAKRYDELFFICLRYILWTVFVTPKFGFFFSAFLYVSYVWVGANYIFINFALSHTHLPVVPRDNTSVDWVRYASDYTINIDAGPFGFVNWWMGYLNYQIEHHLFPSMPQFRQPTISPRVKKFFEDHGLVYDKRSYFSAMKDTFNNLSKVGEDVFLG